MSIGANISVITAGAVLAFATKFSSAQISVQAIGGVLIIVGVISLGLQLGALYRQRGLTVAQAETPDETVLVRPPGSYGSPYAPHSPYSGTTRQPLGEGESPYQSADQYNGNEW